MEVVRLYDPDRVPSSWIEIVRPGQFVAFAKLVDSGSSCDADGRPFASAHDATCLVFDALDRARQFCSDRVLQTDTIRFDIFSSAGRAEPPLLTVVHPSRAHTVDGSPRDRRMRSALAYGLIAVSLPLMALDYWWPDVTLGLAAFLGISLLVGGARMLFFSVAGREVERARRDRVARHTSEKVP